MERRRGAETVAGLHQSVAPNLCLHDKKTIKLDFFKFHTPVKRFQQDANALRTMTKTEKKKIFNVLGLSRVQSKGPSASLKVVT